MTVSAAWKEIGKEDTRLCWKSNFIEHCSTLALLVLGGYTTALNWALDLASSDGPNLALE